MTGRPREHDGPTDLQVHRDDGETRHVGDLKEFRHQVRRHTPRNVGMIGDSIQEVGAARSIVIDENDEVLAGRGTVDAAAERGLTRVRVVDADGTELIAVRRSGLTDEQKMKLALYDNRAADLAEYDVDAMQRALAKFPDINRRALFTDVEFRALHDKQLAHELTGTIKNSAQPEGVPSIAEGYTAFSVVLTDEANEELKTVLDDVKRRTKVRTTGDALLVIVRAYARTRTDHAGSDGSELSQTESS